MDNFDLGGAALLFLVLKFIGTVVPTGLIAAAGVIAVRKSYTKSGASLIASAVLSLVAGVGHTLLMHFMSVTDYLSLYIYFLQGFGILSSGLLAGGLLGLAVATPRTGRQ